MKTRFAITRRRAWLIRLGYCTSIISLAIIFHPALLTGLARAWIVDEPVTSADAVMVLGGGVQYRPFAAARIYLEGNAHRVLVADVERNPSDALGITLPETELTIRLVRSAGVPDGCVETIGHGVTSTHDETLALRDWVKKSGARRVIIPTELFHTRRVKRYFTRALAGTGATVIVCAVKPPRYGSADWWRHEEGLIAFQNEVIKFGYYLIR